MKKDLEGIPGQVEARGGVRDFEALSQDAKVVAGTLFGMKSSVTFHMVEAKPSERARAAIEELLAADFVRQTREHHDRRAVTYRPTVSLYPAFQWVAARMADPAFDGMDFPLTTAIADTSDVHDKGPGMPKRTTP